MQINLFLGSLPLLHATTTYQIWYHPQLALLARKRLHSSPLICRVCYCCSALFCYDSVAIRCLARSVMWWDGTRLVKYSQEKKKKSKQQSARFEPFCELFRVATVAFEMQAVNSEKRPLKRKRFLVYCKCTYCDHRWKGDDSMCVYARVFD